jgi:enoyl-CoA hydratase
MTLEVKNGSGIQTWILSFPPVNPINEEFLDALHLQLQRAVADPSVAAVVITSGLRVFSAGADAAWMSGVFAEHGADGLVDRFNIIMNDFRRLCIALRSSPLLVLAALNGHALAGGLELAVACDLRFAANSDGLKIGVPEMDLFGAMPTGGGGAQFIARLMGPTRALQFILDGKPISPAAAAQAGLVDRLCAPETLLAEAETFASDVARKAGRIGVGAAKRGIFGGEELPLANAMMLDESLHWDAMRRGNFKAGVANFIQRFG